MTLRHTRHDNHAADNMVGMRQVVKSVCQVSLDACSVGKEEGDVLMFDQPLHKPYSFYEMH